ncbi:MAG TPA: hypothetical protein VEZ19_07355 [Rubrobacter sp.]|nr:hypothetical protein [Rubrobacter sp.]
MSLTHEYMHQRTGYRLGSGSCWIRIYKSVDCDAPVVVCEALPEAGGGASGEVFGQLAAEVIREHFAGCLPDLPRPLLWIEHRPARRRGRGRYFLHTFPSYRPRIVGAGFVRRVTLGASRREPLNPAEVDALIREA